MWWWMQDPATWGYISRTTRRVGPPGQPLRWPVYPYSTSTLQGNRAGCILCMHRRCALSLQCPAIVGANTPSATKKAALRKGQGRSSQNQIVTRPSVPQQRALAETWTAGVPEGQGAEGKVFRWPGHRTLEERQGGLLGNHSLEDTWATALQCTVCDRRQVTKLCHTSFPIQNDGEDRALAAVGSDNEAHVLERPTPCLHRGTEASASERALLLVPWTRGKLIEL